MGLTTDSINVTQGSNKTKLTVEKNTKVSTTNVPIGQAEENISSSNKSNAFFKEYLQGKMIAEGINVPEGMKISITSPDKFSDKYKQLLHDVRVDIYGARVQDMFNLLVQDRKTVAERVDKMKISDAEKQKIIDLKTEFDNYYKIQAKYNGKTYDLINLSKEDYEELNTISPDFAEFVKKEQPKLKANAIRFSQGEIENVELSEAAHDSRSIIPVLLGFLAISGIGDGYKYVRDMRAAKKNPVAFLAEQRLLSKEKLKLVNPFTETKSKIKGKKGLAVALALIPIITSTLKGSLDDCCGAGKDLFQDKECFGWKTASIIAGLSVFSGIATSFAIAPSYEKIRDILMARRYVKKDFLKKAAQNGTMDRVNSLRKHLKPSAIKRFTKGSKFAIGMGLFGVLIAASTSGSSWASMAGTRYMFGKNGDDLVKKGIIDEKDNTFDNANKNMMKYEAYDGKWHGIADPTWPTSDPILGFTLGASGLLTHTNPILAATSFGLQGCSETLTACGFQALGETGRSHKLKEEKQALIDSVK